MSLRSGDLTHMPWLMPIITQWDHAILENRLGQALLVLGPAGLGQRLASEWLAQRLLCEKPTQAEGIHWPCGECGSCHLYGVDTHPDIIRVLIAEDKKQIAIDDIRKLMAQMALKANRGGYKVAIIDPADGLNVNSANALLKTLEEPPPQTVLVLCLARLERLPATIASRCQRFLVSTPNREVALRWLNGLSTRPDWSDYLNLSGGAPLLAFEYMQNGAGSLLVEMNNLFQDLSSPKVDLVALAERSAQHFPLERLRWLELWVEQKVKQVLVRSPGIDLRGWYELWDEVKRSVLHVQGTLNVQVVFERVYLKLGQELARERRAG